MCTTDGRNPSSSQTDTTDQQIRSHKGCSIAKSSIHPHTHTHIQQILQSSPKPGATAAQFFGTAK